MRALRSAIFELKADYKDVAELKSSLGEKIESLLILCFFRSFINKADSSFIKIIDRVHIQTILAEQE